MDLIASHVWLWLLGTLTAYRLWRLLALDDLPGVAETRDAADRWATTPTRQRYVDAIRCPWCLGFWSCVAVFGVLYLLAPYPWPVLNVAAASTVVGLIGGNADG